MSNTTATIAREAQRNAIEILSGDQAQRALGVQHGGARALNTTIGSAGGFTVGEAFLDEVNTAQAQANIFLDVCDRADPGDPRITFEPNGQLKVPYCAKLPTAAEKTENDPIVLSEPEMGHRLIDARPVYSGFKSSIEWEQDSGATGMQGTILGLAVGNKQTELITGDLSPLFTSSGLTGITAENLFRLRREHIKSNYLRPVMRDGRSISPGWMAHPITVGSMRLAMQSQPDGWESFDPITGYEKCDGYPVYYNEYMPTTGAGAVAFGAWGFAVIYRPEVIAVRRNRETLATDGQVLWVGISRVAGSLTLGEAIVTLAQS